MIIGDGDIAKALKSVDRKSLLFFASGVSNSREKRESQFNRERNLLLKQMSNEHIVYFSSLCVFYSNTPYALHKKEMEFMVTKLFNSYTIVRLGNIDWGDNPNTIINYFRDRIKSGRKLVIRDTYRYIVSKKEFLHWMKLIPSWNCEMNIPGRMMTIKDIVKDYVNA